MSTALLYVLRHGETAWNREGRLQGRRETELTDLGRTQAEEAGVWLRALLPDPGALPWWTSPMRRAAETARLARAVIGLDPEGATSDPRLAELSFGAFEGLTWREVRARSPAAWAARRNDPWNHRPPGGESYPDLCDRLAPWLAGLDGPAVVVAHGGVARALAHLVAGVPPGEAARLEVWQGRVLVLRGETADPGEARLNWV